MAEELTLWLLGVRLIFGSRIRGLLIIERIQCVYHNTGNGCLVHGTPDTKPHDYVHFYVGVLSHTSGTYLYHFINLRQNSCIYLRGRLWLLS